MEVENQRNFFRGTKIKIYEFYIDIKKVTSDFDRMKIKFAFFFLQTPKLKHTRFVKTENIVKYS